MLESYYGPPLYSSLYTDNVDIVHSLLREAYRDQIDEYMANTGTGGGNKVVNSVNSKHISTVLQYFSLAIT